MVVSVFVCSDVVGALRVLSSAAIGNARAFRIAEEELLVAEDQLVAIAEAAPGC